MSALTVLTVGVSLVVGLQAVSLQAASLHAMDIPTDNHVAEWSVRQQAGRTAMQQHDYSGAIQLFGEAVGMAKTGGERTASVASYGIALHRAGRDVEARPALEGALAAWGDASEDDRLATKVILAAVDRGLGDYEGSEMVLRALISDRSASDGRRATAMVNLVDLMREEARQSEAAEVLNEASRFVGLPRQQQINIMVESAELTRETRRWSASIEAWNRLAEIADSDHSAHLEAIATGGLGETWYDAGNLTRAEPLLRRSLQLIRNDPASTAPELAAALAMMGRLCVDENKLALAREFLDEAVAKDEDSLGPGHPQTAMMLELRAAMLSRRGEAQAARDDLERARAIMNSHFGADSTALAGVYAGLGDVESRDNHPAAAALEYKEAMDRLNAAGVDAGRFGSALLARYAAALKAAHRPEAARDVLRSAGVKSFR